MNYRIIITLAVVLQCVYSGRLVAQAQEKLAKLDRLFFIENKGQWDSDVLYLCRMGGLDFWITKYGVNYTFYKIERNKAAEFSRVDMPKHKSDYDPENEILLGHRVLFELHNYNPNPTREGKKQLQGYHNYFIGNDESKHATYVGLYKEVVIKNRVYEQKFLKESTQIYFILIFNVLDVKVES